MSLQVIILAHQVSEGFARQQILSRCTFAQTDQRSGKDQRIETIPSDLHSANLSPFLIERFLVVAPKLCAKRFACLIKSKIPRASKHASNATCFLNRSRSRR